MSIPATAKKPQDHKQVVAAVVDDDELLANLPELAPPTKLRLRQRNKIMKMAIGLRSLFPEAQDGQESVELDLDNLADEDLARMLDVLSDVDDFAESIASNVDEYITWAQGASYEQFSALLSRYSSAVGESSGSSS